MGTYNPTSLSTGNLLRGLRGFIRTVIIGVISAHEPPSRWSRGGGAADRNLQL